MESEKRLYDLLITVYRSPELMIKMTGVKQKYLPEPEAPIADDQVVRNGAPELAIDGNRSAMDPERKQKNDPVGSFFKAFA